MRKLILATAIAVTAAGVFTAPKAEAQTYPSVSGLTPFSPECGFMSKPGYLRYRYFVQSGKWISYEEAARIVTEAGG